MAARGDARATPRLAEEAFAGSVNAIAARDVLRARPGLAALVDAAGGRARDE